MGMKQPKDYVTKKERVIYTKKEKFKFWWRWHGRDLFALITFAVLVILIAVIDV